MAEENTQEQENTPEDAHPKTGGKLPKSIPDDNAKHYANVGPGDTLALTPDGDPIIPVPARPEDKKDMTNPHNVLRAHGLVEIRNPQTGMMEQYTIEDAKNKMQQLENFKNLLSDEAIK